MIPLKDNVPTRNFPVVTVGLIAANVAVWFWEWKTGVNKEVLHYGYYPCTLKKEVPGFVENRVLYAIMRECLALVDEGVVDAEEGGGDVGGDAEVALEERGEEVVGGVEAAGLSGVGPGAGTAAADAEVVLEAGVEAGGEGGGQGGDGGGVRAGEGGLVQVVPAAGPGRRRLRRFRLRGGAGDGEEAVVPLAVAVVAG